MPNVLAEPIRAGAFIIKEASGFYSRTGGTITAPAGTDMDLPAGLVMSMAAPTSAAAAAMGTNAGNGSVGAITAAPGAVPGNYVVNLLSGDGFVVENPDGVQVAHGKVGTPVTAAGLTFTIAAGTTPFAAGDSFTIAAPFSIGAYAPFTGAAPAAAVLFGPVSVRGGRTSKATLMVRTAELNGAELSWDPAAASPEIKAAAAASLAGNALVLRGIAPSAG